ncbi:MAG: magnesium transporter MgtE N-terminal domain-containing protein [Candidatus Nanopelagicales bacterium]
MTSPSRVFVARLARAEVFDPKADQVGRARDVVVALRTDSQPPRVVGLVVEVVGRRRIFVPMSRVTAIDSGQVVVSGVVNLRRFQQRQGETLALGELLDRRVTLVDPARSSTPETVTIVDLAIEQRPNRDWHVTQLFIREGGGLRRKGQTRIVDWAAVDGLTLPQEQGAENLIATLDGLRAPDVALALQDMPAKRRIEVARELDDDRLADVLEELPEDEQVAIMQSLDMERAADVLEEMDPDDAADLISELPPDQAKDLLERMEPDEADDIRRLLVYGDYTAGGMMTTEPVVLPADATVAEALARVRSPELAPSLAAQVYVTRAPTDTPTGRYLGTCHFQRMLREPPAALVSGILDTTLEPISPETDVATVARYFATYNLVSLPVVDADDRLLGAVTVDDLIDHMLPADWRDNGGAR